MFESLMSIIESGGLFILLILIFLEGNPFVGSFIPGQVLIFIYGFLISTANVGSLQIAFLLITMIGFLGDLVGYYMGRYGKEKVLKVLRISNESKIYKSSCAFFNKYGPWSLVLGRQIYFTRAFVPFMAGISHMKFFTFFLFALLSNIIFALFSLLFGYFFGHIFLENIEYIFEFIFFLVLYIVGLVVAYKMFKKFYTKTYYSPKLFIKFSVVTFIFFTSLIFFLEIISFSNFHSTFNSYFLFLSEINFLLFVGSLFTQQFIILCLLLLISIALLKSRFKLFLTYFWGLLITGSLTIILSIFFTRLNLDPFYIAPIYVTLCIFYIGLLVDSSYFLKNFKPKKSWIILTLILFVIFWSFVAKTQDSLHVLISFIVGVLISEFIFLLSRIGPLDTKEESMRI